MTTIENELLPWHQFDYRTDRLGCERFHAFWDWNVMKYSDKEQRCTEEIENRLSNEAPMHVGLPFHSFGPGCSSKMPWKLRCHWLLAGLSSAPVGRLLHSLIGKILKKIPIPAEKWVAPRPSGYPLFDPTVGNNSSAIYPSHSSSLFRIYMNRAEQAHLNLCSSVMWPTILRTVQIQHYGTCPLLLVIVFISIARNAVIPLRPLLMNSFYQNVNIHITRAFILFHLWP